MAEKGIGGDVKKCGKGHEKPKTKTSLKPHITTPRRAFSSINTRKNLFENQKRSVIEHVRELCGEETPQTHAN
jgi:hypothetical protein